MSDLDKISLRDHERLLKHAVNVAEARGAAAERERIRRELIAALADEDGPDIPKPVLAVIHRVLPLPEP